MRLVSRKIIMPLSTFFNLQESRQTEIREAAFEEFALHDFESASVSRIVSKLGMSNGTFFRYFKNKIDLYSYLMDYATQMRLEKVEDLFLQSENFYDLITQNFLSKVQFDLKYPLYGQFLYNCTQERNSEAIGNMMIQTKTKIMNLIKQLMAPFQQKGLIRTDIEADLIAFFVLQIQMGVYDFLAIRYGVNLRDFVSKKNPVLQLNEDTVKQVITDFTELLRAGMKPATDQSRTE